MKSLEQLFPLLRCFLIVMWYMIVPIACPVSLSILNDVEHMMLQRSISINISLNSTEQALYYDSLRFSLDVPDIELISWHAVQKPTLEYISSFKQNRKVYLDSATIKINFSHYGQNDIVALKDLLTEARLYVACLVVNQAGSNRSITVGVPLAPQPTENKNRMSNKQFSKSIALKRVLPGHKPFDDQEDQFLTALHEAWRGMILGIYRALASPRFFQWYWLLFAWVLFLMLARFVPFLTWSVAVQNAWLIEMQQLSYVAFLGSSFYVMRSWLSDALLLFLFVGFCLLVGVSYVRDKQGVSELLGKIRFMLGVTLLCLVLPLLLKAWMLYRIHAFL